MMTIGFSPCPNDTFIFYAMLHHKIDTEGIDFIPVTEDVESLNKKAFDSALDITKLSFHAYAYVQKNYLLLNSGSALGSNCGPLFISGKEIDPEKYAEIKVAIPGKYTTAYLLFKTFYPQVKNLEEMIFSSIENAILEGRADAGVIIHENRFTYEEKGLKKIADLGELWETGTGNPIPLGGIVIKRTVDKTVQQKIDRILKRSVEFALSNEKEVMPFVRKYSQELREEVMMKHIRLYVNDYTVSLGIKGRLAVEALMNYAMQTGLIANIEKEIFV